MAHAEIGEAASGEPAGMMRSTSLMKTTTSMNRENSQSVDDLSRDGAGARVLVRVRTGDRRYAGTDANVRVTLMDADGRCSRAKLLSHAFRNELERNQASEFHVRTPVGFGSVKFLMVSRDAFGFGSAWFLDRIEVVESLPPGSKDLTTTKVFPFIRWIKANKTYIVQEYDCCLPQKDHHFAERTEELRRIRQQFQYAIRILPPIGPIQFLMVSRDAFGFGSAWFLDRIEVVESLPPGSKDLTTTKVFPFIRWIKANKTYIVQEYDCCLPQKDHHFAERTEELRRIRQQFQYAIRILPPIGPIQVKHVPLDEDFAGYYFSCETDANVGVILGAVRCTIRRQKSCVGVLSGTEFANEETPDRSRAKLMRTLE
ncbi:unnamed protein product [Notodromas monacha]|uniref:PLAT domain-containing protein n=1 Tax=Notodromas monacha TaxID=399045 RepID=A0A7R9BST8_9CRUS|nr:unnamed protein product [Notodromas monacha]CAG0920014.1 unnamed protein product [Notodromas monacha]